jgi:F0F1-type ATP synthase assembly protein I
VNNKSKQYRLENGYIIPIKTNPIVKRETEMERSKFAEGIELASSLGFTIAVPIAGGAILGSILDQKFKTMPKITLVLLLFGIVISFMSMYRIITKNSE